MIALEDLIDSAERLQRLAAEARAECETARARLETLRRQGDTEPAQLLAGLAQVRAKLHTIEGRR